MVALRPRLPVSIVIRGKICKLEYTAHGAGFIARCMFLLKGTDLHAPAWTQDVDHAEIRDWTEAEEIAKKLNAHAVVVTMAAIPAVENARPLCGATREDRIANYQAELQRRRLF